MSRRRYRCSSRSSFASVVSDSAHLAAKLGPRGALVVGAIGFVLFYVLLPLWLSDLSRANTAQLTGPAAAGFAQAVDQVIHHRLLAPCRCVGLAIPLACAAIAAWKVLDQPTLNADDVDRMSSIARLVSRLLGGD